MVLELSAKGWKVLRDGKTHVGFSLYRGFVDNSKNTEYRQPYPSILNL